MIAVPLPNIQEPFVWPSFPGGIYLVEHSCPHCQDPRVVYSEAWDSEADFTDTIGTTRLCQACNKTVPILSNKFTYYRYGFSPEDRPQIKAFLRRLNSRCPRCNNVWCLHDSTEVQFFFPQCGDMVQCPCGYSYPIRLENTLPLTVDGCKLSLTEFTQIAITLLTRTVADAKEITTQGQNLAEEIQKFAPKQGRKDMFPIVPSRGIDNFRNKDFSKHWMVQQDDSVKNWTLARDQTGKLTYSESAPYVQQSTPVTMFEMTGTKHGVV